MEETPFQSTGEPTDPSVDNALTDPTKALPSVVSAVARAAAPVQAQVPESVTPETPPVPSPAETPASAQASADKPVAADIPTDKPADETEEEKEAHKIAEKEIVERDKADKKEAKEKEKQDDKDRKKRGLSKPLSFSFLTPKLSPQERINFARHLSVTVKSGIPLLEGLRLVEGQAASKRLSKVLKTVMEDVNNGQTLAQALDRYHKTFGDFFISMVQVGEASGNLAASLLYLSTELKKQREISGKARSAMIYPSVILIATVGMTVGLTVFIFPKIIPIFTSLKVALPFTTRLVIQFMTFIQTKGFLAFGVIVGFIIFLRSIITVKVVHLWFDRLMLAIPVVAKIVIALTLANFTRSLGILLKSGMTLIDALAVTKVTFKNLFYRHHVEQLIDAVRRGEEIAKYMSNYPQLFPPMLTGMIKVGENTGNLEENLFYLAEYYTEEVESSVQNLTSLLEPLLVLTMGLVVGFIALSIITPIYSITQGLKVQ